MLNVDVCVALGLNSLVCVGGLAIYPPPHTLTPHQSPNSSGLTVALMWVMHSELTFEIPQLHSGIWYAQTGRGGWGLVPVLTSQMMVTV